MVDHYGAIEAGGTKFVCAVIADDASGPKVLERVSFPTSSNTADTLRQSVEFLRSAEARLNSGTRIKSIGIASFGPVDLWPESPTFGYITSTPKPGWAFTDLAGVFRKEFGVPVGFDTDVNGAALGEKRHGAGKDVNSLVYFTVGTGIGGGALINGDPIHGLVHTEMGHVHLRRHPDDTYKGWCTYHHDCFEGLACGPAMQGRWGVPASQLGPDHPAWEMEAFYLAEAVCATVCMLSPERVILGGGVMHQEHLFPMVRKKVQEILNNYVQSPAITEHIDTFVVPPGLGDDAGIVGAMELARRAAK